jgi:nitrite reductase/ring-hydroxylating ferredoxin subunit
MSHRIPVPALQKSTPLLVVHDGVPYCVLKTKDGALSAFVAACSHKARAILPLRLEQGKLVCPHHRATFDPTTGEPVDRNGKHVPTGLCPVELTTDSNGTTIRTRKRHKKLLTKKERRRVAKLGRGKGPYA